MAEKINRFRSYGEKLLSLFARLLFSGESYSLTQLSRMLECSKPTVLRLIDDIRMAYSITVEETMKGNRKYFRIKRPGGLIPAVTMTEMEMQVLQMCRAFAENLLGRKMFDEATMALLKSRTLLADKRGSDPNGHFASFRPGSIDYTPHQNTIRTLIEAMEEKRICKVSYQKIMAQKAKTLNIKPLKIFSHHDTVYLHARFARTPGKPFKQSEYDPLLPIHRFKHVEMTDRKFEFPTNYDFEKVFNQAFGIMGGKAFEVEVEFTGKPAEYVAERTWSADQRIIDLEDGKIRLVFRSSSRVELVPWVLAYAGDAKVIRPEWLVEEIKKAAESMLKHYGNPSQV